MPRNSDNRDYVEIITFREFEEKADINTRLIFPYKYEELSPDTLGVIYNNTFTLIEFASEALENYMRSKLNKK